MVKSQALMISPLVGWILALPCSAEAFLNEASSAIPVSGNHHKGRPPTKQAWGRRALATKHPWERPYDPGFFVQPIPELEEQATVEEIDYAIDFIVGQNANANIIRPYKPKRSWLWTRWRGTILQRSVSWALLNMSVSLVLCWAIRRYTTVSWGIGEAPLANQNAVIARLAVFERLWKYMMTMTTFILTFFLNQAYSFWKDVYTIARRVQGRMNDISLLLATHVAREKDGTYTKEAQALLDDIGSHLRSFHVLFWASCARRFRVLLTEKGLQGLVKRGVLKQIEKETLQSLDLPATQKHNACLEWIVFRYRAAVESEVLVNTGAGFEQIFLDKICTLRGTYATIGDKMDGRMPLAYTHFVQIMVDIFLVCAPFAQLAETGAWSVVSVGFLTLFYASLLDLAKVFLDPLDNEETGEAVYIDLGVLIREANAGSVRWKNGAARLPFSTNGSAL